MHANTIPTAYIPKQKLAMSIPNVNNPIVITVLLSLTINALLKNNLLCIIENPRNQNIRCYYYKCVNILRIEFKVYNRNTDRINLIHE